MTNRVLAAFVLMTMITLSIAFFAINWRKPVKHPQSSTLGVSVPVNDTMNSFQEVGIDCFPQEFPPSEPKLDLKRFSLGAPYRVLEVKFLNSEETIGMADVEEMGGSTFLTVHPRVIRLKPGTFFCFPADKLGKPMDEPREIDKGDLTEFIHEYLRSYKIRR